MPEPVMRYPRLTMKMCRFPADTDNRHINARRIDAQSVHGLWTDETTKVERFPDDETVILAEESNRAPLLAWPGFPIHAFRIGGSFSRYGEKSAESMNPGKLDLEKRYVRLRAANCSRCEEIDFAATLSCETGSCCPRRRRQHSVRCRQDGRGRRAWQSIAVFPVVHQTQLCQETLQRAAPGRRPGIRPL